MTKSNWNSPRIKTCCGEEYRRGRDMLWIVWNDMNDRCTNPNHPAYSRYKDFSIEWVTVHEFKAWAKSNGYVYGLQLDRIDNSLGYGPNNCRFITASENSRNRKDNRIIEAFGERKTLVEWSEDSRCKVQAQSIAARIDRYGFSVEEAISQPASWKKGV